tara:strand:+ start:382 stop:609 length:228 start_codon:yes stop_codon:yes gene_type:complete
MDKVIDKELISHLLRLENNQQEKVLAYMKDLLIQDEMNKRTDESEMAISEGRTKSFDQFNRGFEQWKANKRASMK